VGKVIACAACIRETVTGLDWFGVFLGTTPVGQLTVCNFTIAGPPPPTCVQATAGGGFVNNPFTNQTSSLTFAFDATPQQALA